MVEFLHFDDVTLRLGGRNGPDGAGCRSGRQSAALLDAPAGVRWWLDSAPANLPLLLRKHDRRFFGGWSTRPDVPRRHGFGLGRELLLVHHAEGYQ